MRHCANAKRRVRRRNVGRVMDDDFYSEYLLVETAHCALPDLGLAAMAAGVVVVALALIGVGAMWVMGKLRTW